MKPMITHEGGKTTLDLTKPLLVWAAVWGVAGLILQSWTVATVAILPIVFIVGFALAFILAGAVTMGVLYLSGQRIKVTNHKTGTVKYVQRRR